MELEIAVLGEYNNASPNVLLTIAAPISSLNLVSRSVAIHSRESKMVDLPRSPRRS